MQTEPENKVPKMFGLRYHQLVAVRPKIDLVTQVESYYPDEIDNPIHSETDTSTPAV